MRQIGSRSDNLYGAERGILSSRDSYRNEDKQIHVTSPAAPPPGEESVGPMMYDLVRRTARSVEVQEELIRAAIPLLNTRSKIERARGQTPASGNFALPIYRVPQGFQFIVTRLNVEAEGFSPAVPYTNAAGALFLAEGDGLNATGAYIPGSAVDFLPNPPLASGAILPASVTDGASEAGIFKGGTIISLVILTPPVSTDIYVRLQGIEEPL